MRILIGTKADGTPQVSDADTGQILDWVYAIQYDLDPTRGPAYAWFGTPHFSALTTVSKPPTPTPSPTPTPTPSG